MADKASLMHELVQPVGRIKPVKFIQPVESTVASLKRSFNWRADSWSNQLDRVNAAQKW